MSPWRIRRIRLLRLKGFSEFKIHEYIYIENNFPGDLMRIEEVDIWKQRSWSLLHAINNFAEANTSLLQAIKCQIGIPQLLEQTTMSNSSNSWQTPDTVSHCLMDGLI